MVSYYRVLGAGVWGLAFSNYLLKLGHNVDIFCRDVNLEKKNLSELSQCKLYSGHIKNLSSLKKCDPNAVTNIIATNSTGFVQLVESNEDYFAKLNNIVWLTKGLEHNTGKLFSSYLINKLNQIDLALISGPSFAEDLCLNEKMEVSVASNSFSLSNKLIDEISSDIFSLKATSSLQAIEIAGFIKNIAAILCGMTEKLFSKNKIDFIITKACDEVISMYSSIINKEIDENLRNEIINSPGCLGDMNLTCKQKKSRNYRFGSLISDEGISIDEAIERIGTVEGYTCCLTLIEKSKLVKGDVTNTLYEIISKRDNRSEILKNFLQL